MPDGPRGTADELELPALLIRRDPVALVRRGEAALRAERESIERHVARGLCNPALEALRGFKRRALRADEAQNDHAIVGHVSQRLERAGALVVVLEQEPLEARAAEDLRGDPVVPARRVEHAPV